MNAVLSSRPRYFRSSPAKAPADGLRVDRRGGDNKAGIIRGVSLISRGEALGHDLWVDAEMLAQVADKTNESRKGIKSRFTHPSLSGDGMGRYVGRVKDAEVLGDRVVGDLHLATVSHATPDGDLGEYLMTLAETDPEAYGLSIVFSQDDVATGFFEIDNTEDGEFVSPDSLNTRNLPHARVAELRAVDTVDEPAANPQGLFHRGDQIAIEADGVAAYAVGLTDTLPGDTSLGVDPDRLRQFVGRFLSAHSLSITKEPLMANEIAKETNATEELSEAQPAAEAVFHTTEVGDTAAAPEEAAALSGREEAQQFHEAYGIEGLLWYAEGKTFTEAGAAYVASLKEENERLSKKLASLSQGETEPVEFSAEESARANHKPKGLAGAIRLPGN